MPSRTTRKALFRLSSVNPHCTASKHVHILAIRISGGIFISTRGNFFWKVQQSSCITFILLRGDNGGKDIHLKTHTCGEEACGSIWSTRDDEFVKFGNKLASRCESQKTHEHLVMLYQSAWRKLHPIGGEPPMDPSGNSVDFLRDPRFICEKPLPWLAEVVQEAGGPAFVDLGVV